MSDYIGGAIFLVAIIAVAWLIMVRAWRNQLRREARRAERDRRNIKP